MKATSNSLKKELDKYANKEKAAFYPRFFKTAKGQYGEGDKFIGVVVPDIRKVARQFKELPLNEVAKLLNSPIHEHRHAGLFVLVHQFKKSPTETYNFYLKNLLGVNNWDLVDLSAPKIVGAYLLDKPKERKILHEFAKSKDLWERRISIIATYTFIKNGQFEDTLKIATTLLKDDHDLIHKAVGWMLREAGKQKLPTLTKFLDQHHKVMPRTMLRYAIEKLSPAQRKFYMN